MEFAYQKMYQIPSDLASIHVLTFPDAISQAGVSYSLVFSMLVAAPPGQ